LLLDNEIQVLLFLLLGNEIQVFPWWKEIIGLLVKSQEPHQTLWLFPILLATTLEL